MKKFFILIITSFLIFTGCSTDEDKGFNGLSISELKGEWILVERTQGNNSNDLINLNICESGDKLIITNNNGLCTHIIAKTSNDPCGYDNLSIKLSESTYYLKIVEKIDSSNLEYSSCNIIQTTNYGKAINLRYYLPGNPENISDIFKRVE